ncbi:MAG: response regulator [Vicinamibacterales bacterium]|nr:response regulator [Vicinamibacterales bacterium]
MTHKLLLADDSVTIQRVIELTFADEDVEVTAVGDGQLAIERLNTDRFDIVLADVDMPKHDGYEVAAYVKSRPKLAHIPVVLLTGAFEPIDQARARAAGSSDVLAKPFEPQMVINRVKQLLGKKTEDGRYDALPVTNEAPAMLPKPPAPAASLHPEVELGGSAAPVSLDDYFDQLDAAFSNLQTSSSASDSSATKDIDWPVMEPAAPEPPPPPKELLLTMPAAPVVQVAAPPVARPVAAAPPPPPPPPPAPEPVAPPVQVDLDPWDAVTETVVASARPAPPPAPAPAPHPPAPPPVIAKPAATPATNPFASLSAAKAEVAAARASAPVITEEIIEEVVARVLQRMSDRVVRETVTEIVSQTAERLVQEEIERIRASGE